MKPELEKLCREYIANRDAVAQAFRWDNGALHAVCANIFCACGQAADPERLKQCRGIIRSHTHLFSKFRGKKIRSILASLLSLGERPEDRMDLANEYYRLLKRRFRGTVYLVLSAFLLADLADKALTEQTVARGKDIYRRMNRKHRILTDKTDSVFAMLLAHGEASGDGLIDEIEIGYQALNRRFSSGGAQTASQVLAMAGGAAEDKARRVVELYDALREAGVQYGRSSELAPLAALSLADTDIPTLVEEIRAADAFLKTQKGYEGTKDAEQAQRAMYAVMIVSDQYAGTRQVNITVMTNTLDMLFSREKATMISFLFQALQVAAEFLPKLLDKADAPKEQDEK